MFYRSISLLFAVSAMTVFGAGSTAAATDPGWQFYFDGPTYEKVWDSMPSYIHEEAHALTGGEGRLRLPMAMATEDLNNDGKPELLATIPRDPEFFPEGYQGDVFSIFSVNRDGSLLEIMSFRAFGLKLASTRTNGVSDLLAFTNYEMTKYVKLAWSQEKNRYVGTGRGTFSPNPPVPKYELKDEPGG